MFAQYGVSLKQASVVTAVGITVVILELALPIAVVTAATVVEIFPAVATVVVTVVLAKTDSPTALPYASHRPSYPPTLTKPGNKERLAFIGTYMVTDHVI